MHITEIQFELLGKQYVLGTMDCFEQFHVARKMAPVVAAMGGELFRLLSGKGDVEKINKIDWIMLAMPVADVFSKMTNEESEYILRTCLKYVKRKDGDTVAPVMASTGQMMFADLKMMQMLRLVFEMLRHNLGDFFLMGGAEANS